VNLSWKEWVGKYTNLLLTYRVVVDVVGEVVVEHWALKKYMNMTQLPY